MPLEVPQPEPARRESEVKDMAGPAALDYYYGQEAEQYSFYRIPKALFTDERFRRISAEAKVLYGLFLDRMSLSVKNGWMDAENRVFIYFTLEDALELLCCGHTKAVALFAEVEKVGLIERKKQGQGKPTKIYVKNFVTGGEVQTSEKRKSRLPESGTLDFPKTDASNTEKNHTELSDTDLSIHPPLPEPEVRERRPAGGRADAIDTMERMSEYREVILENIAYDVLAQRVDRERLDEVVELLVETVCSRKKTIRIGGEDFPTAVVRSRLLKLDDGHVEYVLDCLGRNTTKVRNIRAYLLTSLYNAPSTINSYYTAEVGHDLYGGSG